MATVFIPRKKLLMPAMAGAFCFKDAISSSEVV
jgi:hypothetical protein